MRTIERHGVLRTGGIEGTFKTWVRADGAYRLETQLGPTRRVVVFDGKKAWVQDGSSRPRELDGAELAQVVTDAYLESLSAVVPGRLAGTTGVVGGQIQVAPAGGEPTRVALAPATCLPSSFVRRQSDRTLTTTVEAWETVDGVKLPSVLVVSTGDPRYDTRQEVRSTRFDATLEAALFTPPSVSLKPDLLGKAFVAVPVELGANHLYLRVSVNGAADSWFVLDTGAEVSVMDAGHATGLGLRPAGAIEARGVGEASIDAAMIASPRLGIGALAVPLEAIYTVPLRPIWQRAGRALHGILGYDVLGHFVVEIDYAARVVRFHDPERFAAPAGAAALPVTFDANVPAVRTEVEVPGGRRFQARMTIDTGASGALTLSSPFIDRHGLRTTVGGLLGGTTGRGIAGASKHDLGRLAALHLGPHVLRSPVTAFSTDSKGAAASPDVHGNIGGEVLRRFTVTFDYPRRTMYLVPNAALAEPFEADMSGLQVINDEGFTSVVVEAVVPGTPAAEAGVLAGDVLVSVDGQPAEDAALVDLRKLFREPGRTFTLVLRRAGVTLTVPLKTRRLV